MKLNIQIKNRYTGSIIFELETENNSIKKTIEAYIEKSKPYRADLTRANLADADLTRANLTRANLTVANLTRADLTYANLTVANLTRANLTRADLTYANLTVANLTRADLLRFKNDFWRVLLFAKNEIPALRQALIDGKINGSAYEGECACLKGTIANAMHCDYNAMPGLVADISEPSEQWFLQIQIGMKPETSNVVKITVSWIDEFVELLNK